MGSEELTSNYVRFSEKALRIAMLLASLENGGKIELRHWARGQEIAERWRANLHDLFELVTEPKDAAAVEEERKILEYVDRLDRPTPAEIGRYLRSMPVSKIADLLEKLKWAGALDRELTNRGTFRYSRIVNEETVNRES